jgi:hypothetical protein
MGSRGPHSKDPKFRRRRNKPPELEQLPTEAEARQDAAIPPIPKRPGKKRWSQAAIDWWAAIHRSPMNSRWLDIDRKGILPHLLLLHQFAHEATDAAELVRILSAINALEARLGVGPGDRKRMGWEVPVSTNGDADAAVDPKPKDQPDEEENAGDDPPDPRAAILDHAAMQSPIAVTPEPEGPQEPGE